MSGRIASVVRARSRPVWPSNSFTTTILQLTRIGLQAVQALRRCRSTVFKTLAVPVGAVTDALSSSRRELWLILGDGVNQAADLASGATSIPSWNLTPWMTFGNWF